MSTLLTLKQIQEAQKAIHPYIHRTLLDHSSNLSALAGTEIYLKLENLQKTGSFKVRGAMNKALKLSEEEKKKGVLAASAGNHAQGVAMAAARIGIPSTIVMPENAPLAKVSATEGYGAQVILSGAVFDDAYQKAVEIQKETGATFIHAFDDLEVMAGQGTIGLEVFEELPEVDTVLVPIGGGGLIAGIAVALKSLKPSVRIIGVQAAGAASMAYALNIGKPEPLAQANTLADGIAVKRAGDLTFATVRDYVDEMVTVEEEEISQAILLLMERTKTLAEGAGAVAVAAALQGKINLKSQKTVLILSGGNIDVNFLAQIIERGLRRSGRTMACQLLLPDQPGNLEKVIDLISQERANIINIEHSRYDLSVPLRSARVHMLLETQSIEHQKRIIQRLEGAGYPLVIN
ncbi:L-threonine ammonia-lyase [Desulfitobacterium dehalogenans ATCC 51507]|uniref:threonine ammonia-lyase n=1 Tax=Desulfitobacterium dehalogenans (strain ATCC 51507 / DSM 9161 / JW/IU-DC1) TaxID=756499 RepID=I4A636_DESDJ|nr:threonine ammonia-lyase [Desulfitobacterium dehalogenans]AFL99420.1 L-threonine ammonia-lyase [Desulfitobacterium dehalogenans ATCC 51507]